jgi:glycosyltransferase involved in cell wall biosynthesis
LKKILIISEASVFLENGGFVSKSGGASSIHNFALSFKKMGFDVSVFALKEHIEQTDYEVVSGINYFRKFSSNRSSFRLIKYLFLAYRFSKDYDIVFFNQFLPYLLLPFFKKKTIVLVHDVYLSNKMFWFKQFGFLKGLVGFFVEFFGLYSSRFFADKIVVVSESTKEKLIKLVGRKVLNKTLLIPNSVDLSNFYSLEKEKFILFVGRFVSYKRPNDLIFVLKKIQKEFPEFSAKFVMTREFLEIVDELKEYAQKLGVENFELIPCVSDEKLKELYAKASLLVHPSVIEGQGIVLLEALASNTPVCAYDLDAYKGMLINGKNCELAKIFDKDDLAQKTIKILNNLKDYQSNAKISLLNYSMDSFDENVKRLF